MDGWSAGVCFLVALLLLGTLVYAGVPLFSLYTPLLLKHFFSELSFLERKKMLLDICDEQHMLCFDNIRVL
jgi:hypothetical protein